MVILKTMANTTKPAEIRFKCSEEMKARLLEIAEKEERKLSGQVLYFLKKAIENYPLED